jgi:release factor glutamine methyltransferase
MKVFEVLKQTEEIFKNQGICDYKSDARFLMEFFLNCSQTDLILNMQKEINYNNFLKLANKRLKGIPVQYITGNTEFMSLEFNVNKNVLIPRQDTEILVEKAIGFINENNCSKIFDICTGSGCIAISLWKYTNKEITATDISKKALKVAEENKRKHGAKVTFINDNILNTNINFKNTDVIVSNPPYIKSSQIPTLDKTVKDAEPYSALDGGDDGLVFYKKITSLAENNLVSGGALFFEIGYDQGDAVRLILEQHNFKNIQIIKDYNGNNRVVFGTK